MSGVRGRRKEKITPGFGLEQWEERSYRLLRGGRGAGWGREEFSFECSVAEILLGVQVERWRK